MLRPRPRLRGPRLRAPSRPRQRRNQRPGRHPALTRLRARRGAAEPAPAGTGRLLRLGGRRLLAGVRGRVVCQRQPGLRRLRLSGAVQGPHRAAGALRVAATASGAGTAARPPGSSGQRDGGRMRAALLPSGASAPVLRCPLTFSADPPEQGEAGRLPCQAVVPAAGAKASTSLLRSG